MLHGTDVKDNGMGLNVKCLALRSVFSSGVHEKVSQYAFANRQACVFFNLFV